MTDSQRLLAEYARDGSEAAFRELVSRYIDLVYSTALRMVEGEAHRAQDVAQMVFMDLARQAPKLSRDSKLGGWLHRDTCFVAAKVMRGERRRQIRERQAAEMNALNNADTNLARIAPVLDEAINGLADADRKAILLRFYERMDLSSVGEALGISEDGAQKRVSRALERLRLVLKARGATVPAAMLGMALAGEVVKAAPAGLAVSTASTVLASATVSLGTSATIIDTLIMSKAKLSVLGTILVVGTGTILVQQHLANVRLQSEVGQLRAQLQQPDHLSTNRDEIANSAEKPRTAQEEHTEVLRLRGIMGALRGELAELRSQTNRAKGIKILENFEDLQHSLDLEESRLILTRDSLKDRGLGTPEAAVETYLWTQRLAMSSDSFEEGNRRVKEITWIPPGAVFGGYAKSGKFDPFIGAEFARLEAITRPDPTTVYVYVAFYDREQGFRSGTSIKVIQEGEAWKIDMGLQAR